MNNIKLTEIKENKANKKWDEFFSAENAEKAKEFHEGIPEYEKTPLACLSDIAEHLGVKSVVYMPKVSTVERLENIRALGADASITEYNYDDTVRFAQNSPTRKCQHSCHAKTTS